MQNESSTSRNKILMDRIGVLSVKHSIALIDTKQSYDELYGEMYPTAMNPSFGVFHFIGLSRDSIGQVPDCDRVCSEASAFFNKNFVTVNSFPSTDFASSFLFVMKQRNETQESVAAKSAHGRRQMAKTMAKTTKRMEALADIPGTIRNMTASTWIKMSDKMAAVVAKIDDVIAMIGSERANTLASRYSFALVAILLVPLLLAIVVVVLAVTVVWDGARSEKLRTGSYASLALLSLTIVAAMLTFLIGGTVETELCRYLRTGQTTVPNMFANGSRLALDGDLNGFLARTLPLLPKTEFPTPSPNDVLYGLVHRCRDNEPIMVAIDAIRTFDARSLSKPEASAKIIAVGRMLMLESLNETDPAKMMPADMADSLKQAAQMDMFKKVDVNASIAKIPRSPVYEQIADDVVPVSMGVFLDRTEKLIAVYGPRFRDQRRRTALEREFVKILALFERFSMLTDGTRELFRGLGRIPEIEPVVKQLQASLKSMLALMTNKPALLALANDYFDKVIVANTPANAAGIMAKFGPKMMAQLGPCRPLFDSYEAAIDTGCDVVLAKINAYWLYLGTIVLLLTVFVAVVLVVVVRPLGRATIVSEAPIDLDEKKAVHKPLVDSLPPVAAANQEDQSKVML